MPSPFPGMNPYFERASVWESFRLPLVVALHWQLAAQLSKRHFTQIGRHTFARQEDGVPYHEKVRFLTIRDRDGNHLITVVELLSPTSKYAGPDREQYLAKRREILRSRAHLVEIDLLRGGPRMPPDELPTCDYCAIVSRAEERTQAGVWPWRLRDPIPRLPVPLRPGDADAVLDLKAALDQMYDIGRYANYIYNGPPEPRLAPDDMAWAAGFLPTTT